MISPRKVDVVLGPLEDLLEDSSFTSGMKDQYIQLLHELRHLKTYLLGKWYFCGDDVIRLVHQSPLVSALQDAAMEYSELLRTKYLNGFQSSDSVTSELLGTIQLCKPEIKEYSLNLLDSPFELKFSIANLPGFMNSISTSLQDLLDWRADTILDMQVKIVSLKKNLDWLTKVFNVTRRKKDLNDLKIHTQALACRATCIPLLCWVSDVKKENLELRMEIILSDLHTKTSPSNPEITRVYIAGLKALDPSTEHSHELIKLVELLKDNLVVDPVKDDIQMLFNDLIFLIRFLMKHQEVVEFAEGISVLGQAEAVCSDIASVISLLCCSEIKEGIAEERNLLLHASLEKAKAIKGEVRKLYAYLFLDPSSFNFPKINVLGFIDSLLENLNELSSCFRKHQLMVLHEELLSLKQSNLQNFSILELQNKHQEIKDLWNRIIKVAYNAERAISSFIYIMKASLWEDDILCLSDVIEEVKLIKGEVKRIQDRHILTLNFERSSSALLSSEAKNPKTSNVVVGFKTEVIKLVDQLLRGSAKLHVISILGMPGLGKTTLAKKIFNDASVQCHFHRCAWCTVSQQFNRKKILLDILRDIGVLEDPLSKMDEEDIADKVRKSLIGRRYFIVMDDIWDVSAWHALKMSFPDDENGSRILFTSRIHNVIPSHVLGISSVPLNPLSEEESWELLSKKLFNQDSFPSEDFIEIGRQIATNCKGLPLSIVIIAGLLKEKIESLDWWKQVGESLDYLITREGCEDVVELSYRHLPEYLKPCFLYFGLFKEDEEIRVKKLILLWVAEGLIQKQHEIKSLEAVAEEYLKDLVARSLVIVSKRSSTGGIKTCSIHDLLRDFCIGQSEEENFYKVIRENKEWNTATTYAHYRVGIQATNCWSPFLKHVPPATPVYSLLTSTCEDFGPETLYTKNLSPLYFKFLQVLDLDMFLWKFPEEITKLVHLRCLALYFCCPEIWLPPSVKRLENLEIIFLKTYYTQFELEGGSHLLEMQKLRHVDVPSCRVSDFWYTVSLSVNMRTLFSVIVSSQNHLEALEKIPGVQKLRCVLHRWEDQILTIGNPILTFDFLCNLESLYIRSNFVYPLSSCEFQFPKTLKKLRLVNFYRLHWSEISPIANLPNLEVLKLYNSFSGKTWSVEDGEFLKLKCLVLEALDIQQLNAFGDSFPCLERLDIDDCPKLKRISPSFGSIPTLKMIQVKRCGAKLCSSLREIQEEQHDMGNEDFEALGAIDDTSSYQEEDSSDAYEELD